MTEIAFLVEDDADGGLTARAIDASIFTQADDMATLREAVRDAVQCHFEGREGRPTSIHLRAIHEKQFRT